MLFTDMLLVTKPATKRGGGDKLKIIKPPMRLDRIVVYGLRDAGALNRRRRRRCCCGRDGAKRKCIKYGQTRNVVLPGDEYGQRRQSGRCQMKSCVFWQVGF